jgi:hypothetical protein
MKAVALAAAKARSLADLKASVKTFQVQLEDDMIYSNMLEHNLCRFGFTVPPARIIVCVLYLQDH